MLNNRFFHHYSRFFLIGLIGFAMPVFAQKSLQVLPASPTIQINSQEDEVEIPLSVKNIGTTSRNVRVQMIRNTITPNHETFFCWTLCYTPSVLVSPHVETISPGETNTKFRAHFRPEKTNGKSTLTFVFYVDETPADSTHFTMTFNANATTSVRQAETLNAFATPNPTHNQTTIRASLPASLYHAELVLYNLLGKQVLQKRLTPGQSSFDLNVAMIPPGLYYWYIVTDIGRSKAQKLYIER